MLLAAAQESRQVWELGSKSREGMEQRSGDVWMNLLKPPFEEMQIQGRLANTSFGLLGCLLQFPEVPIVLLQLAGSPWAVITQPRSPEGLSKVAQHWLGLLDPAGALCIFIPTENAWGCLLLRGRQLKELIELNFESEIWSLNRV